MAETNWVNGTNDIGGISEISEISGIAETDVKVVIAAAGSGSRFGGPKQFAMLGGEPVLRRAAGLFEGIRQVSEILVALPPGLQSPFAPPANWRIVAGKGTRQESVAEAVLALAGAPDETLVLVHDGARPFASRETIGGVARMAHRHGAALAARRLADTLKREAAGFALETVPRDSLWRAATPQGFRLGILREIYGKARAGGYLAAATDDAELAEKAGYRPCLVESNPENIKITARSDLALAEAILGAMRKGQHECP